MAFLHSFAVGDFLDSLVSLFAAFVLGGLIGDHLGVQLMILATRSVRLTPIGASFAAEIRDVLEHVVAATSAATGQASGTVSVSTIDSFAARWLMPRLSRFRRVHGDIDVRVATSERLADFVSDGIDIAIRCGGGQYPGLTAELLMKDREPSGESRFRQKSHLAETGRPPPYAAALGIKQYGQHNSSDHHHRSAASRWWRFLRPGTLVLGSIPQLVASPSFG